MEKLLVTVVRKPPKDTPVIFSPLLIINLIKSIPDIKVTKTLTKFQENPYLFEKYIIRYLILGRGSVALHMPYFSIGQLYSGK